MVLAGNIPKRQAKMCSFDWFAWQLMKIPRAADFGPKAMQEETRLVMERHHCY